MSIDEHVAKLSPNAHHATDWFRDRGEEQRLLTDSTYPAAAEAEAKRVGNLRVSAADLTTWRTIIRAQLGSSAPPLK